MDEFYKPPYSSPPSTIPPAPTRTPPPLSNAPLNPSAAIFNAVLQNNVGLVRSILNTTKFNPNNFRNKDGKTPLMVASIENCPDIVKYLVGLSNINIDLQDNEGESALYQAASVGNAEIVDILINANANVESCNKENITPLIIAAYNGHADVCRILIDHGYANVNFQDSSYKTALSLASFEGHIEVAKVLLARNANVHITDQYGWTALMFAAFTGREELCQLLLNYDADGSIKTINGKTAAILAHDAKHFYVANLIEDHGRNNNSNNYGSSNINNGNNYSSSSINNSNNYSSSSINNGNNYSSSSINNNNHLSSSSINNNTRHSSSSINDNNRHSSSSINNDNRHSSISINNNNHSSGSINNNNHYSSGSINNNNNYSINNNNNYSGGSINNNYNNNNYNIDNNHNNNNYNDINNIDINENNNYNNINNIDKNYINNSNDNYNNINNNYNGNNNINHNNINYNKPIPPPPHSLPPHRLSGTTFQGTPSKRFPIAMTQPQIKPNFTNTNQNNRNFYPEIPINNTRGYLMPLNRNDSKRTKIQRKNVRQFNLKHLNNITGNNITNAKANGGKLTLTAPHLKNDMAPRENKTPWVLFSLMVTACCCNPCLSIIGKMKDPNVRQAWREKVALVIIILSISLFMGFITFGMATVTCGARKLTYHKEDILEKFGPNQPNQKMHIIRGRIYNTGEYILFGSHRPLTPPMTDDDLLPTIMPTFGSDISDFFPLNNEAIGCPFTPKNNGPICNKAIETKNKYLHCHTSDAMKKLKELDINERVVYSWENITDVNTTVFVYGNSVYDLGNYLDPSNEDKWLGDDSVTEWLKSLLGKDSTSEIVRTKKGKTIAKCLPNFIVGEIEGTTIGCLTNTLILIMLTILFTGISLIKFISAIAFDWLLSWQLGKIPKEPKTDDTTTNIILMVACYSEGENSMRTTLDSLATTDYSDKHKLLMVIADGDITGSENNKSTPQICKDLIEPFDLSNFEPPIPKSYLAIGDGKKQHNMAEVIIGYYNCKSHRVPICLINKVGTPEERKGSKAGNRGKRDSQLILMKWISNIFFNERMTPLEFELFEKVRTLTGITPDKYEMVLMVDADTLVMKDSVGRMVAAMERDPTVMGLCGETKIANKTANWVTMIQVFEYFISHHLGKSFESIFGGVTCLPGCFCMYRIKAPKYDGYSVPILANPDIVELYSSNSVETLHQKNLLLLGEDRYLTTLMLRAFPKRKMIYVPKAICKTVVPDEFKVLLSQRRRWINSTVHNLLELVLVPQLCGIFCCSMQFVIFLELIGTVILPSSIIFILYLIYMASTGVNVTLPLLFIAASFFLQAFLVIFTAHKITYILWMIIFILAMPVWNFILPVYAFWHFDDFSWGATRKISGEDNGHGGNNSDVFERNQIPRKKWIEWKVDGNDEEDYDKGEKNYPLQNSSSSQQTLTGGFPSFSREDLLPPELSNTNNFNNFDNNYNYNNNSGQNIIGTRPMGPRGPNNPTGAKKFDIIRY